MVVVGHVGDASAERDGLLHLCRFAQPANIRSPVDGYARCGQPINEARPLFVGRPRRDAQFVCLRNRRRHKQSTASIGCLQPSLRGDVGEVLDDRADFPVRPVCEVDRLNIVVRRGFGTECAVSDSLCPLLCQAQPNACRKELDVSVGQRGDFLGRVPGGRHEQDSVGMEVEVARVELAHQPPHEDYFRQSWIDGPISLVDAGPQLRWPPLNRGEVGADVDWGDLLSGQTPK